MINKKITVIGAGLGGLAVSCLLANEGCDVQLFEKNETAGGKMQEFQKNGFRFDTGPSLFTMPFILEKLFNTCNADIGDYLTFKEIDPVCKYFYPDGTIFNNYTEREKTLKEIEKFAPEDLRAYTQFLDKSEELYQRTADAFLFNPLYDLSDLKNLNLFDLMGIDAFSTVSKKVDEYFESDYLRKFFKRFTTYNGSSPYQAPATLNVIPHVELNQGGYYIEGGMYNIADSLFRLAKSLGVHIHFKSEITGIETREKSITACEINGSRRVETDIVVSNADATDTLLHLLPKSATSFISRKRQQSIEPSCSGFVMLLGCNKQWPQLAHHNIFFSDDYRREFDELFKHKKLPEDPTIYISNTSSTEKFDAPQGCSNLFILVNAPYIDKQQNWKSLRKTYSEKIKNILEFRGLNELMSSVILERIITPDDFLKHYRSNKGSIYGTSSNSVFSAFLRPRNKNRSVKNLYLTGGSTHPGGGIPLVIQSAFNAAELMKRTR